MQPETAKQRRKRSIQQNRYLHGIVYAEYQRMFAEKAKAHLSIGRVGEWIKEHVTFHGEWIRDLEGNRTFVPASTTKLSTVEFEDYCEQCRAYAAGHGVEIALPNETI